MTSRSPDAQHDAGVMGGDRVRQGLQRVVGLGVGADHQVGVEHHGRPVAVATQHRHRRSEHAGPSVEEALVDRRAEAWLEQHVHRRRRQQRAAPRGSTRGSSPPTDRRAGTTAAGTAAGVGGTPPRCGTSARRATRWTSGGWRTAWWARCSGRGRRRARARSRRVHRGGTPRRAASTRWCDPRARHGAASTASAGGRRRAGRAGAAHRPVARRGRDRRGRQPTAVGSIRVARSATRTRSSSVAPGIGTFDDGPAITGDGARSSMLDEHQAVAIGRRHGDRLLRPNGMSVPSLCHNGTVESTIIDLGGWAV